MLYPVCGKRRALSTCAQTCKLNAKHWASEFWLLVSPNAACFPWSVLLLLLFNHLIFSQFSVLNWCLCNSTGLEPFFYFFDSVPSFFFSTPLFGQTHWLTRSVFFISYDTKTKKECIFATCLATALHPYVIWGVIFGQYNVIRSHSQSWIADQHNHVVVRIQLLLVEPFLRRRISFSYWSYTLYL